jgi:hypothetical protein
LWIKTLCRPEKRVRRRFIRLILLMISYRRIRRFIAAFLLSAPQRPQCWRGGALTVFAGGKKKYFSA